MSLSMISELSCPELALLQKGCVICFCLSSLLCVVFAACLLLHVCSLLQDKHERDTGYIRLFGLPSWTCWAQESGPSWQMPRLNRQADEKNAHCVWKAAGKSFFFCPAWAMLAKNMAIAWMLLLHALWPSCSLWLDCDTICYSLYILMWFLLFMKLSHSHFVCLYGVIFSDEMDDFHVMSACVAMLGGFFPTKPNLPHEFAMWKTGSDSWPLTMWAVASEGYFSWQALPVIWLVI